MVTSVWIRWALHRDGERAITEPALLEQHIAEALAEGDGYEATLRALEGWGREVLGMLLLLLGDQARATTAFSTVESMARDEISAPCWPESRRVWLHILGKRAADAAPQMLEATPSTSCTPTWPSAVAASPLSLPDLHETLDVEDKLRLVLRIRRRFSWREIAAVIDGVAADDESALCRAAQRQRLRHRTVELRLRARHQHRSPKT